MGSVDRRDQQNGLFLQRSWALPNNYLKHNKACLMILMDILLCLKVAVTSRSRDRFLC